MTIGPLQLVAIGFDEDKYYRDIVQELGDIRRSGIIRLFDALYIIKHLDGTIEAKETSELGEEEKREYGTVIRGLLDLATTKGLENVGQSDLQHALEMSGNDFGLSDSEVGEIADQIPVGTSALIVLFEHKWAVHLKESIGKAGGRLLAQGLIQPETLKVVSSELTAVMRAVEKVEATAFIEAAEAVATSEAIKAEAALEALDALLAAELIEEAARQEALETLHAARLIEAAAITEAAIVVAEAEAIEDEAIAEAEMVVAVAEAVEEDAIIEAGMVVAAAEAVEEEAILEAAVVVSAAEQAEADAIARALQAMIAADIIEEDAADRAINAIVNAQIIEIAAAEKAAQAYLSVLD